MPPDPEVIYLRIPTALRTRLDAWVEDTGKGLSDLCRDMLTHAVDYPPENLAAIRDLRRQLREREAEAVG